MCLLCAGEVARTRKERFYIRQSSTIQQKQINLNPIVITGEWNDQSFVCIAMIDC